jgi:hypothetical protein
VNEGNQRNFLVSLASTYVKYANTCEGEILKNLQKSNTSIQGGMKLRKPSILVVN